MTTLQWTKSDDGFCETKDGRFYIKPIFLGRTRAVGYELIDETAPMRPSGSRKVYGGVDYRVSECKAKAQHIVNQENAARSFPNS